MKKIVKKDANNSLYIPFSDEDVLINSITEGQIVDLQFVSGSVAQTVVQAEDVTKQLEKMISGEENPMTPRDEPEPETDDIPLEDYQKAVMDELDDAQEDEIIEDFMVEEDTNQENEIDLDEESGEDSDEDSVHPSDDQGVIQTEERMVLVKDASGKWVPEKRVTKS